MDYYNVFIRKAGKVLEEQEEELLESCLQVATAFFVPEFKTEREALRYVYQAESNKSPDTKKMVRLSCAFFISLEQNKRVFNLYLPGDEHFQSRINGNSSYCETNRQAHDAIVKILMFLLARYSNGFYSHDGEPLDYFFECLDNYHPEDREIYLKILNDFKKKYNLQKFGIK